MAKNRGKQFEQVIKDCFEKVPGVSLDRLHDQTTGFKGSQNICDFVVYREPYEYYIECKSVHGNTFSISSNDSSRVHGNITNTQWDGLLEKSKIPGVFAGIILWFIDKDKTFYIPIELLQRAMYGNYKSLSLYVLGDLEKRYSIKPIELKGKKKRVFFDYDMEEFFNELGRVSK